jgi:hypothetical protein
VQDPLPDPVCQLAANVLVRLQPGSAITLLDLARWERRRYHEDLRNLALRELERQRLSPARQAEAKGDSALLGELAFERAGRETAAAAFYALEHDTLSDLLCSAGMFLRGAWRWRLARALLGPGNVHGAALAVAVLVPAVALTEALAAAPADWRAQISDDAVDRLRFHLHELLGTGYRLLGRPLQAAPEYGLAACLQLEPRLQASAITLEAESLGCAGQRGEARSRLDSRWWRLAAKDRQLIRRCAELLTVETGDGAPPDAGRGAFFGR